MGDQHTHTHTYTHMHTQMHRDKHTSRKWSQRQTLAGSSISAKRRVRHVSKTTGEGERERERERGGETGLVNTKTRLCEVTCTLCSVCSYLCVCVREKRSLFRKKDSIAVYILRQQAETEGDCSGK